MSEEVAEVQAESRAEWRAWLEANHASAPAVWLVTWKKASGRPQLAYDDAVEEALCFGWVDSRSGAVDAERSKLYLAPRRAGSGWSRSNKERVERLLAAGMMAPAGVAAVERARADGTWALLDAVERLEVPPDLAAALAAIPGAREGWEAFPRSERRRILEWIVTAKRPETRAARVGRTAADAAAGVPANRWRPR